MGGNTKNISSSAIEKENNDLMTLAIIKLGDKVYNGAKGDEGFELLHFWNTIMYPHREDFIEELSDYIDFIQKLQKFFALTEEKAEAYYERFASEPE